MMTSTEQVKQEYQKDKKRKRLLIWLFAATLSLVLIVVICLVIFWPKTYTVYHLNNQCSTDYFVQHAVFIGKAVIFTYEQVKVCP